MKLVVMKFFLHDYNKMEKVSEDLYAMADFP